MEPSSCRFPCGQLLLRLQISAQASAPPSGEGHHPHTFPETPGIKRRAAGQPRREPSRPRRSPNSTGGQRPPATAAREGDRVQDSRGETGGEVSQGPVASGSRPRSCFQTWCPDAASMRGAASGRTASSRQLAEVRPPGPSSTRAGLICRAQSSRGPTGHPSRRALRGPSGG